MDIKLNKIISLACILLISGLAAANCGRCEGDKIEKKTCPSDCRKVCCRKAEGEKMACYSKVQAAEAAAPDFTLNDINGEAFQLSRHKGKIIVLEWTNYDCPFVKAHYDTERKTMIKLAAKYADKDVVWVTINSTHYATAETNKEWAEKHQLKQTLLIDSDGKVGKLYQAKTTPHLFIIDKESKIAYNGAIDNAPLGKKPDAGYVNYVDKALTELLEGKAVSTPKTKPYGCSVKYAKK